MCVGLDRGQTSHTYSKCLTTQIRGPGCTFFPYNTDDFCSVALRMSEMSFDSANMSTSSLSLSVEVDPKSGL